MRDCDFASMNLFISLPRKLALSIFMRLLKIEYASSNISFPVRLLLAMRTFDYFLIPSSNENNLIYLLSSEWGENKIKTTNFK